MCLTAVTDEIAQPRGGCTPPNSTVTVASSIFIPLKLFFPVGIALCPHPSLPASHPACLPARASLSMHCLRHSFQQMERRRRGEGKTEREKGEEEGAVCLSCISVNITATPASVTGRQGGRQEHNGALTPSAAAAPPPPPDVLPQIRPQRFPEHLKTPPGRRGSR